MTLRAKLLRDPAWCVGAYDLWDVCCRPQAATTAAALVVAVNSLGVDDVLPPPGTYSQEVRPAVPGVCCARSGFSKAPSTAAQPCGLVTFSVFTYDTERRTMLERSSLYLAACRCFVALVDTSGFLFRDPVLRVPGLSVDECLRLIRQLLEVGFGRPATAVAPSGGEDGVRCQHRAEMVGRAPEAV